MLKKTIRFQDFDGEWQEKDYYFNLTAAEIVRQELLSVDEDENGVQRGLTFREKLDAITKSRKGSEVLPMFEDVIRMVYGEREGDSFMKSAERSERFLNSAAWNALFLEFLTDPNSASDFINGVMPDLDQADQMTAEERSRRARERSQAQMQGYKRPEQRVETVNEDERRTEDNEGNPLFKAPPPPLSDAERAELEELRALKASQGVDAGPKYPDLNTSGQVGRPPHESHPGV